MARARNIKPAFFTNDELAEIEPIGRLLFIGLWTIADCNGNLEWREKKIKAQILPYDSCETKEIMINLDKSGFVRFYSDGGKVYLNITNFDKHQNPHKNEREKGSEIPKYSEDMRQVVDLNTLTINRDKSGLNRDNDGTNRADSLNLIPDSLNPINNVSPDGLTQAKINEETDAALKAFMDCWKACKKKMGVTNRSTLKKTKEKWDKHFTKAWWVKHTLEEFEEEVNRIIEYAASIHVEDDMGFCPARNMMTGNFFSSKGWEDE
ncbi:MAG: hypothetical protein ABJG42_24630 [Vibrio splendidus]